MGEFITTEGYKGYASEGYRKTGKGSGVTAIYKGKKKKQGSTLIYKKGQAEPAPITPQAEPPKEYTIKDTTGQPINVKVKPESSYPGIKVAQRFKADITTEQAQRIAQGLPPPRQRVEVAVSTSDIQNFNAGMKEVGISGAKDFLTAINIGKATINPDNTFTITQEETITKETPSTSTTAREEEINKKYFGTTEYYERLTKEGTQELGAGLKNRFPGNNTVNPAFDTRIATGAAKTLYGGVGWIASAVIEPAIFSLFPSNPYKEGVPENEAEYYTLVKEKQKAEITQGALQLGIIYGTLPGRPRDFETAIIQKEAVTANKEAPIYLYREPTLTKEGLKTFGHTPQRAGLTAEQSGLLKNEIQAQLKPTETINIYGKRGIFEYKKPVETESIFAPEAYKPEYHIRLGRMKYQSSFGTPSEAVSTVKPEQIISIFREENPSFRTADLTLDYPQAVLLERYYKEPSVKVSFLGNKKAQTGTLIEFDRSIYEKGGGGNVIDKFKTDIISPPETKLRTGTDIISPPETKLRTGTEGRLFIPVAIGTDNIIKPVTQIDTSIYSVSKPATKTFSVSIGKSATKTITETEQETEQGVFIKSKSKVTPKIKLAQAQIQETITEEKTTPQLTINKIFKPINKIFKPIRQEKPEPTPPPTPPPEFKKFKIETNKKPFGTTGYNVFVKSKGIFSKANKSALSKSAAINFGAGIVEKTTSATFKITPSKTQAQGNDKTPLANLKNFYTNKKGYFIEKPSARINTFGELQGITFKGIKSKRLKKLFG